MSTNLNLFNTDILFDKNLDYPKEFPKLKKVLNDFMLVDSYISKLKSYNGRDQYLNDDIIDVFFSILPELPEKFSLQVFCT